MPEGTEHQYCQLKNYHHHHHHHPLYHHHEDHLKHLARRGGGVEFKVFCNFEPRARRQETRCHLLWIIDFRIFLVENTKRIILNRLSSGGPMSSSMNYSFSIILINLSSDDPVPVSSSMNCWFSKKLAEISKTIILNIIL